MSSLLAAVGQSLGDFRLSCSRTFSEASRPGWPPDALPRWSSLVREQRDAVSTVEEQIRAATTLECRIANYAGRDNADHSRMWPSGNQMQRAHPRGVDRGKLTSQKGRNAGRFGTPQQGFGGCWHS